MSNYPFDKDCPSYEQGSGTADFWEKEADAEHGQNKMFRAKIEKLESALAEAKKGLEFYSDTDNWIPKYSSDRYPCQITNKDNYYFDGHFKAGGKTARTTLQRIEEILKEEESPKFKSRWDGASYVPDRGFKVGDVIFMDGGLCWRQITEISDKAFRWKDNAGSGESPIERLDLFYIAKELRK